MEVVIRPTAAEGSCLAADLVESVVATTPRAVLGLATGSSPVGLYDELGHRVATGRVSFAGCRAFLLDEYVGLPTGHPQRYRSVIDEIFVRQVGMSSDSVDGPNGNASDLAEACVEYERRITEAGGVDIQLLGLGSDGHDAFNEPSSSLASRTRLKTLTRRTREDNARFFGGDVAAVPRHCLTQGLGTILEARRIVLIAAGVSKAPAVRAMVEGPVSALVPASVLQLHPRVTVILDEPAASLLQLADYYREVWENKPAWQRP